MSSVPPPSDAPDGHGKFSLNEDWAATVVGLLLVAAALLGLLPEGIVP